MKKGDLKVNKVISVLVCNSRTGPKDIPSINFECFAIFALKDAREGDDLILTGRVFHIMLSR